MVRLYLFAEGQTEQTFADTVLKPHLAQFGVFLSGNVLIAHARKRGKVHRGGGRAYQPMADDIRRFVAQEKGGDVFFTTMIDLYAIPTEFPGLVEAEPLRHTPRQRVVALEQAFAVDINDRRFIPHIQLHEFEAYLFVDVFNLRLHYETHENELAALKTIADECPDPELIDDGPATAPSKRIIAHLPDYEDAKAVVGPEVAQLIGLPAIRRKCPHFDAWVTRLEQLQPLK